MHCVRLSARHDCPGERPTDDGATVQHHTETSRAVNLEEFQQDRFDHLATSVTRRSFYVQ